MIADLQSEIASSKAELASYKEKYARKLNIAGAYLFGGDLGFILGCRSLNEFIEHCLRLAVFWPTMFYGVEWVNAKLAQKWIK